MSTIFVYRDEPYEVPHEFRHGDLEAFHYGCRCVECRTFSDSLRSLPWQLARESLDDERPTDPADDQLAWWQWVADFERGDRCTCEWCERRDRHP